VRLILGKISINSVSFYLSYAQKYFGIKKFDQKKGW
jgi:hypothetical protein